MHEPTTATRSGFAEPTAPETNYLTRIAALEDHLRNETRSSQALAARVKELEALLKVLGVVPEYTPGTEPTFLPLAFLRADLRPHAHDVDGCVRYLPLSEMKVEGFGGFTDAVSGQWVACLTPPKPGTPRGPIIDDGGAKRREFFGAICDDEQARDASEEVK